MTDRIILCSWHNHIGNIYLHNIEMKNVTEATAAAAKSLQSCPTLSDPIDGVRPRIRAFVPRRKNRATQ